MSQLLYYILLITTLLFTSLASKECLSESKWKKESENKYCCTVSENSTERGQLPVMEGKAGNKKRVHHFKICTDILSLNGWWKREKERENYYRVRY